ncbi:MAG: ribosomal protein S18-alanine N-acetyltransferase [Eubacteriaceae bacterium]|nr:ribosomal protein S18-alanine N-acetyltransferase [Eubacteriaceae bacterium]
MIISIAQAKVTDVNAIFKIEQESFTSLWPKSLFINEIHSEGSFVLCAKASRKIIGYICAMFAYDEAHITNIAVRKAYRRAGVATSLIKAAIEYAEKNSIIQSIVLEVRVSNEAALALYEKSGFEIISLRPGYYSDGEDAYIMQRHLVRG